MNKTKTVKTQARDFCLFCSLVVIYYIRGKRGMARIRFIEKPWIVTLPAQTPVALPLL